MQLLDHLCWITMPTAAAWGVGRQAASELSKWKGDTRGYLLLKWGTLGSNLLKCPRGQMGSKPVKSATWQQPC